jgi:hypothetical protein
MVDRLATLLPWMQCRASGGMCGPTDPVYKTRNPESMGCRECNTKCNTAALPPDAVNDGETGSGARGTRMSMPAVSCLAAAGDGGRGSVRCT